MRSRFWIVWIIVFSCFFSFAAGVSGAEKLDRGLVAIERGDGSVFLSWRLLDSDPEDMAFRVGRMSFYPRSRTPYIILTKGEPYRRTNFVEKNLKPGRGMRTCHYILWGYSERKGLKSEERLGEG